MTLIKITVKGEPDVPPFTRTFHYSSKTDEEIFANLTNMVKDKLDHNLRININETITAFSALVVSELKGGKSIEQIQKDASILLKPEQVMIGVPETLQQMSFEVTLDDNTKRLIVLDTPIRISDYILKSA
ncbi:MAG: urease subunit gamma [Nitrososphaerota archaeon]|nr:urease subunit gamma [Nitrososphaerota archaeon]